MQNKITTLAKNLAYVFAITALASCTDLLSNAEPGISMEGWIEAGEPPIVILSSTIPVTLDPIDESNIGQYTITEGKVTLTVEGREITLTGRPDSRFYGNYIYTTDEVTGEVGKSYGIRAEYGNKVITGSTTIPHPGGLTDLTIIPQEDGRLGLAARIIHSEDAAGYYCFTSRDLSKTYYQPCFLGLCTREDEITEICTPVNNRPHGFNPYYDAGDTVYIRFSAMGADELQYWEDMDSNVTLNHNAFLPSFKNVRSNLTGGYGYWAGYSSFFAVIPLPSKTDEDA